MEKDKRSIKSIADDMFGITFQRKIDEALGNIDLGAFTNKESNNKETKKAVKYIKKIRRK